MFSHLDEKFMRAALRLAERGKGRVSPNPPVGCVLVRDGKIIGRGWHRQFGAAHAEADALADAAKHGAEVAGATAFVTLMPCAHFGKTPPCAHALAAAGIARVVVATDDPNPQAQGGAEILRAAGVTVETGLLALEARRVMAGFWQYHTAGLPHLTLKYAMTLDGKIAQADGKSKWISSEASRDLVQRLRAATDAVMIGAETFRQDAPRLNVRLAKKKSPQPLRVIISAKLNLAPEAPAFAESGGKWIVFHGVEKVAPDLAQKFAARKVDLFFCPAPNAVDLRAALKILAENFGVREILCEGGATLNGELLRAQLAAAAVVFIAPKFLGGAGISATSGAGAFALPAAPRLVAAKIEKIGGDICWRGEIDYSASE